MPTGERRQVPTGQEYGAATEQQEFIEATAPAEPVTPAVPDLSTVEPQSFEFTQEPTQLVDEIVPGIDLTPGEYGALYQPAPMATAPDDADLEVLAEWLPIMEEIQDLHPDFRALVRRSRQRVAQWQS